MQDTLLLLFSFLAFTRSFCAFFLTAPGGCQFHVSPFERQKRLPRCVNIPIYFYFSFLYPTVN